MRAFEICLLSVFLCAFEITFCFTFHQQLNGAGVDSRDDEKYRNVQAGNQMRHVAALVCRDTFQAGRRGHFEPV